MSSRITEELGKMGGRLGCDCTNGSLTSNFYAWFVGESCIYTLWKHAEHLTAVGCKFRQKAVLHFFCLCQGQHTLPMGLAEDLRAAQVKIFCPKCEQAGWRKNKGFLRPAKPSLHSRFGINRSAAGLCCQKQIQRAWRSFFWDVQLSCFQNSFCDSMAFQRNFEGPEWLVFVFQN